MKATLRALGGNPGPTVEVGGDEPVRVFRDPDRMEEVVAKRGDEEIPLGVRDASVSREFGDDGSPGYVEFYRDDAQVYVEDAGTRWGATLQNVFEEVDLSDGEPCLLTEDCTITIGYNTDLGVEVERDGRVNPSTITIQADMVYKISSEKPAKEVEAAAKDLRDMMKQDDTVSGPQYRDRLEALEEALVQFGIGVDMSAPLSEAGFDDVERDVATAARRIRNFYRNR